MAEKLKIDLSKTAILSMDYQNMMVSMVPADSEAMLKRASQLLAASREVKIPVIHVVVGFRKGYPEISSQNAMFSGLKQMNRFVPGDPNAEIHPSVAAREGDIVVTKHRVSGFAGSDLDMVLRSNHIENLVMFGISTSGVVLSTLRYASDQDFRCTVIKDCCADTDAEVHQVLTEKVFPRQATVLTAEEFLASIR